MRNRHRLAVLLLIGFVLGQFSLVQPASADNFGSQGGEGDFSAVSFGNNDTHKIDIMNLVPDFLSATRDVMAYYSSITAGDLQMPEVNIGGGSEVADVDVIDYDFGTGIFRGIASCPNGSTTSGTNPNRTCFTQLVELNTFYTYSTAATERLACHELGHTVAMRHTANTVSCLHNDPIDASGLLRDHELDFLVFFY